MDDRGIINAARSPEEPAEIDEPDDIGAASRGDRPPAPVVAAPASDTAPQPAAPAPQPADARPAFVPMSVGMTSAYMLASLLLALTQGFGMNLVTANLQQIQGDLAVTQTEATWLMAAYMAPNVSLAMALIKIRTQFGLRNFAEVSILGFVAACLMNLMISDLHSALVVRFMSGIAAAPMSSLAFLYLLEPMPPQRKLTVGLSLALTNIAIGVPLARIVSPVIIELWGTWHALTLLELALALGAFACVFKLPLAPMPRANVISIGDVVSYLLIAAGFGCIAVALVLGRLYWWFDAPWIGMTLAAGIACVVTAAMIELNRKNPLLDIRWLTSPAVLHLTAALLIFRIVLSEQSSGAPGFYQALGLGNEQMQTMFVCILLGTIAGGLTCAMVMTPDRQEIIHLVSLTLIACGAWMDSQSTNLTRPGQMMVSQTMIAFASALFLPPAMAAGLLSALKKGPNYILSFIIVFLTTQSLGGLLGSAIFGTFINRQTTFHSRHIAERLAGMDPQVAQRVQQYGASYAKVIADPLQLQVEGTRLLSQVVTREATILAYNDAFSLMAGIAVFAATILLCHMALNHYLRRKAAIAASPAAAA